MEEAPKRKTHTSTEVKRRYNQKTYSQIIVSVNKDTAAKYRAKCDAKGIPYSQILKKAIDEFLSE